MNQRQSVTPAGKAELDRETPYFTLLPNMDEGFHVGYRPAPGIQCDNNQKPGEWLENFAKYIQTQGEDVGYSIPDVLASEQQLRRLSRLPHETAMRHQEMIDYRAVLALLLLWDQLSGVETDTELKLEPLLARQEGGFPQAVGAALSGSRQQDGLMAFTLSRPQSETPEAVPLCLLSRSMVLMPAANPGDLSLLLPPGVTWYDRARGRFTDPCAALDERMRLTLIPRLRLLQALNESPEAGSPLFSPEAGLCALLDRFIADILTGREPWRQRFALGDPETQRELRTRVLAVYGLASRPQSAFAFAQWELEGGLPAMLKNPLLRQLTPAGTALPALPAGEEARLYTLDGVAFARRSAAYLLEPAGGPEESAALAKAAGEISLLDSYDESWRQDMAALLARLLQEIRDRTGVSPRLAPLLVQWRQEYLATPQRGEQHITLHYPNDSSRAALSPLLLRLLGQAAESCVGDPFSDCLLLIRGAQQPPFGATALNAACLLQDSGEAGQAPVYFVPPLSPAMAAWLEGCGESGGLLYPCLAPQSLRCTLLPGGKELEARFSVVCRVQEGDSLTPVTVTFVRRYRMAQQAESGAAYALPAAALPSVTVWPNVRLAPDRWRAYYVHAHRAEEMDVWALNAGGWTQGRLCLARDEGGRRQAQRRSWRTAATSRFPAYVALKRGSLSLGALPNDLAFTQLRHEAPAIVSIDFGSIATTVMLRQGEQLQPAALPRCLHGALLLADPGDERFYQDEFLPKTALVAGQSSASTYYSVLDLFSDEPERWQDVLADGHIYYPRDLSTLLRKGENSLYYDLKWSEEEYVLRCLRLFLKQAMLQASLAARLWGSASISWRVGMPGALPLHKQEAYLDMMRGLSREVAQECGLPLTSGCPPVLYALENQADGLYFRSRNEVSARSGYLNLDIGGGTADISLWLGNAVHATAECSLLLGCRQLLYASIFARHTGELESDFASAGPALQKAAQETAQAILAGASTTRGQQKGMLLLDDLFAAYPEEIRAAMAAARSAGRITYVESLLLFGVGFLFHLCGMLLARAGQDGELRPLLAPRMELCIAGNGGQLLKAFTPAQMDSLCQLALSAVEEGFPVKTLLPVQSADPKREVALGLLSDDGALQSTLQTVDRWNGTLPPAPGAPADESMAYFLLRFISAFPQAAHRLLDGVYEVNALRRDIRLTPTAQLELETVWENERSKAPDDDFAAYVRCFTALKRLWKI